MRLAAIAALLIGVGGGCAADPGTPALQLEASMAANHASPEDARSAWVRLSGPGVAALPRLLTGGAGAAPQLSFARTRAGDFTVCTEGRCDLALRLDEVSASATRGSLALEVAAGARLPQVGIRYEQEWACAFTGRPECRASLDTARAGQPALRARARVGVGIDRASGMLALSPEAIEVVDGVEAGDVRVEGQNTCGRIWCTAASIAGATTLLDDFANEQLERFLSREVQTRLCRSCAAGCPLGARCEEGVCTRADDACVPAAYATETEIASPDGSAAALLTFALADEATVRAGGVDVAVRITARSSVPHRCVPHLERPPASPIPASVLGGGGEPSVLRVAIGEAAIARSLFALTNVGVGCRQAPLASLPMLGEGGLRTLFGNIDHLERLLGGATGPAGAAGAAVVTVTPLAAPAVHLDGDGGVRLRAPLEVAIRADVLGRELRLASAVVEAVVVGRIGVHEGAPALELPANEISLDVGETWVSPLLGAEAAIVRSGFGQLVGLARAAIPATLPLPGLRLPAPMTLDGPPRTVRVAGTRALVVDFGMGAPR